MEYLWALYRVWLWFYAIIVYEAFPTQMQQIFSDSTTVTFWKERTQKVPDFPSFQQQDFMLKSIPNP